ncbi:MAG: hypothetical protein ACRCVT_05765 [Leadbetterella sp.]
MRNTIDKESYKLLFTVLTILIVLLSIVTSMLYIDIHGNDPKTLKISGTLLFLTAGVTLITRTQYLRFYNEPSYNTQKLPLWAGAACAIAIGFAFPMYIH